MVFGSRALPSVAAWVSERDYDDVEREMSANDVVFTRIYTMADIFKDPHYKARGMLAQIPDEQLGSITMAAPVPRLTRTPGSIVSSGGSVGRDTFEVLRTVLGLSASDVAQLERDKIVSGAQQP